MKKIMLFVIIVALGLSCSDDSHSSMGNMGTLMYRVDSSAGTTITTVVYRDASGTLVTETPNSSEWSKTIEIHRPFFAGLTVSVVSSENIPESTLELSALLDGQEIESDQYSLPNGTSTHSHEFTVE